MQTVSRDGISYYMGSAYEPVSLNDQFFWFFARGRSTELVSIVVV